MRAKMSSKFRKKAVRKQFHLALDDAGDLGGELEVLLVNSCQLAPQDHHYDDDDADEKDA